MTLDVSKIKSPLGFGCMRFEGRADDTVDIAQVSAMIDRYMDAGGNYFDTAWAYPNSEKTLHAALVERYPRDAYLIASKCVAWSNCSCKEDLEKQLRETLAALGVDYLDVYLMHNLGGTRTASFERYDAWEFVKKAKELGLAKHIGFSAHCTPDELEGFIAAYPEAEVIQLQANYNDWESPDFRERECVEIARTHGIPVIAMEPVKGGILADPPQSVKDILDETLPDDSYATAALRFTASQPGIVVTLSGMSTLDQVEDNCRAFEDFKPLSATELVAIDRARDALRKGGTVQCTSCDYCAKVCPQNVGISQSLSVLNHFINYGDAASAGYQMGFVVRFNAGKSMITDCIRCGACEKACPQNLPILKYFDRINDEIFSVEPEQPQLMRGSTVGKR